MLARPPGPAGMAIGRWAEAIVRYLQATLSLLSARVDKIEKDREDLPGYSQSEANARFVDIAGDTMTGPLLLNANPAVNLGAATKQYADTKEPGVAAGTTAQYWRGDKSWQTHDKASVGLGNVDNTSDANAPVSTAQAAADALRVLKAGDTMTGNLTLAKAGPQVVLDATGLTSGSVQWKKDTVSLWSQATSGADLNMWLFRYTDAAPTTQVTVLNVTRLTGEIGFGGAAIAGTPFTFYGDTLRLTTARTPASATAAGTIGMVCWDSGFVYVCIAANTWRRAALAAW